MEKQQYKQPSEGLKLELKDLSQEDRKIPFRHINCPSCGSDVTADNLNLANKVAKCGNCNAIFSLAPDIDSLQAEEVSKVKQEINRPEGVDVFHFNNELDITLKPPLLDGEILAMAFIPMFAFLFLFLGIVASDKIDVPNWSLYLATVIGLLPFWYSSRRKDHKLHLSIDDAFFSIRWRPKKGIKDKHFAVQDIDQLYVKQMAHAYYLKMIVNGEEGQKHITVVPKITSVSKAHYLEQEIEKYLGIVDRAVPEENVKKL